MLPNLVEIVKGYSTHEYNTLINVIKARGANTILSVEHPEKVIDHDNIITGALKNIFALSESYPDLKANQNFLQLQAQVVVLEDKIKASRRAYNMDVKHYNEKISIFPLNILANLFKFNVYPYFEMDIEEAKKAYIAPKIDFNK